MNQSNLILGFSRLLTLFVVLSVFSFSAHSASQCKGLSSSACSANADCTWVGGFTRSDGAKVKSYCRALPSKSKTAASKKKGNTNKQDANKSKDRKTDNKGEKPTAVKDSKDKKKKKAKKTNKDEKVKKDKKKKKTKKVEKKS